MSKHFYKIVHKNTTFVLLLLLFCIHAIGQNKYAGNTSKRSFAPSSDMAYASNTKSFGYKRMNELSNALERQNLSSFVNEFGVMPVSNALATTVETLPAGTLIIAMDNALQENDVTRLRRAYGLAVRLLHAGVPLKWIIDPNKTSRTAVDLSASARLRYPSTGSYATRNFRTGPIAIFPGFETQAAAVINSYGNGIRVYELQSATSANVHSNLTHKPYVFVEQSQNPTIHTSILSAAGLSSGTHYTTGLMTSVTQSQCVTIITVPHNSAISTAERNAVRAFVQNGGNFFAQCAAIRGFQGSTPRAFLNSGYRDNPGIGSFLYSNPQEPSAQFEGNIADEGGSQENFGFTTDPPGGTRIVHDSQNDYKAYTGRMDGVTTSDGGYVHYLAGHDHDGNINADRYYLNAVLRSAIRPTNCNLNLGPIGQNDTGSINCGGASVTINVLANDTNPLGGPLTVNLIGSGTNGTFVNNNNGTVTYTGNVNGFWGGDQITYQACSGAVCSQATITITSSNPSQVTINGTVFVDANNNGTLNGGETGGSGIAVRLYGDSNNNGVKDSGEPLVTSTNTTAGGSYTFLNNSITPASTVNLTNLTVNDDSYQKSDGVNTINNYESGTIRYKGYRWTGLNIPANATITNATVTVTGYQNGGIPVTIKAENLNAAPAYTSANNYLSGRTVTSNSVTWNVPALSDGVTYTSPDFASVVQQAVSNNNGLTNLSLILSNTTGNWITWNLDDGASAKYQKLNLTYTVPGNPANFVIEVDQTTLPAGSTFTTDNVERANFTALGQLDCNNNFGYISCPTPTISITPTSSTVCTGATLTLTSTVSGGSGTCTPQWQSSTSVSGPFTDISGATSATYTVPTSSSGTVYYRATYTCTGAGCGVATSNVATVVINARPTITGSTPASRCGTGTVTLGATASAGTINWYATASGGASLGTGTSFTTPSIATTTTYYVDATENGCTTASRTAVVATVNAIPTITGTTPASRCGTGTVTLGATASAGTINWYAAAAGGASLGTGTSFTTPSIATTTTYYVDATENGCTTASRTAVVATINAVPTITGSTPASRCGTGTLTLGATASAGTINWYAAAAGGASLGTGTSFTTPSIATTTTYYVDATLNGCTTASRTAVVATINALPTTPVATVDCSGGFGNGIIQVTSPIGANFEYSLNGGAYQSNPLFTGVVNGNATIIARNITTGCTSAPATVNINCGCVNAPTLTLSSTSGSTCGISPITVSGNTFGGSATLVTVTENGFGSITTGSTSNTSPFSFTYTPAAGDIGNVVTITVTTNNPSGAPCAPAISTYTLTVNAIPTITATTPGSRCGTGTVNLGATASGGTINWYADPTGGTSLGSGTSFTTPIISTTTTYYVDATQNGCTTASRTAVVATVNEIPTITGSTPASRCGPGTVNLGATASGGTINWYATINGGSSLGTGTSFTTPSIATTTTYYVDATLNGCTTASRTAVVATVNQLPNDPTVGAITQPSCAIPTGSVQLSDLPSGNWTLTRSPGNVTTTGNTTSTTISGLPAGTYTFTVTNSNNCTSIASDNVVINVAPTAPILGGATQVCVGATANVTPNANGAWGSSNTAIAIVNTSGLVIGVSAGTVTLTYTRFSDGCSTDVQFTVNASPTAPIVGAITQPTCNIPTGSVQLSGLPSGNWTITRFPDNVTITGNTSSTTISGLPIGVTYSFLVVDANNCSSPLSSNVTINNVPTPPVIGGATEVCVGSTTNVTPNSGGIWASSNTAIALVNNVGEVTGVSAGTVTLTFTRLSDGCSNSVTFTVNGNPTAPVVGAITQPTCTVPTGSVALSGLPTGRWTIIRLPDGVFATGELTSTTLINLPAGATYTFLVTNSNNCTSPASGNVVINGVPNCLLPPIATDDFNNTPINTPVSGNVLTNDDDPQGLPLTVNTAIPTICPPKNGTVVMQANGNYTYTPNNNFVGTDKFCYVVCNSAGLCDTAIVTIDIIPLVTKNSVVANDDATQTQVGTPVKVRVLGNDFDPQGDKFASVTRISNPTNGGVVYNPSDSSFTYTPTGLFVGKDSFRYVLCDVKGACDTATVTIDVLPLIPGNDPPVAIDDANITKINVPVSGTVATNDSDPNNDPLTFTKLTNPTNGTVVFNPNGTYTYTPNNNYAGPDRFIYKVCDNGTPNLCDTATVYITVLAQPPVATDDINNTPINTPVVGNVLTNDDDPQGLPLTVNTTIPTICPPQHGTVVMQANGNYTYTPNNNFVGTDKFCYVVCNSAGLCDTATVTIDIIPLVTKNSVVANDDATQTQVGIPVKVRVLGNDFDPQGDKFASVTRISNPTNGGVVYNPSDSSFTYTPTGAFVGKDTFKYVLCDVKGACDTATVTIDVLPLIPGNDPPVAVDDANVTKINVPVSGTVATNDSDPNNDPLTFTKLTNPTNGTVTFNPNGTYTYTPNNNYAGPDRFIYKVCDNGTPNLCDTATVYITVLAQPPVATDDFNNTPINTPVVGNVLTNDDDPQGLPLTVNTTIPTICPPQHGTVVMQANGNYTYTPNNNFVGTDKFCYVVCNSAGLCDTATVTIDIIPLVTKNSVVANDDATQTQVGIPVKVRVLGNDFDPQGDKFASVTRISNPTNGGVVYNPSDSSFTYTPTGLFVGKDSFRYVLCDVRGACDTATVTIDVLPTIPGNDPPVAVDDANVTKVNVPVSGTVATNDSDPNNDPLTFTKLTNPTNGTVVFNPNGTYTYTPNNNYAGPDRFIYKVCDNGTPNLCDTATVYITVLAQPPVATDDINNTPINTPVVGNVLTNDDDPQGLPLTVNTTIPTICPPQHGTVVMQANGNYTYTPNNNFVGTDKFCYVVCNSAGLCDTAIVTIDVIPLVTKNSVVANDDATQTQVGVPVKVRVLGNDFDPQGDKFASVTRISNPANGGVVYNPSDSSFTYTPTGLFVGKDSFRYVLCDVRGACDTATVTIDVLPLIPGNDPPVAVDDANVTKVNVPVSGTVATNDSDPNNDPLTFTKLTNPTNGTVTFNPNGTYTYTPNNNYVGPDRFIYKVCDNGTPNLCDTATVYITILSPDPCVKSKVTLTSTPLCSADIQTYSITFTVTGQVGILKANKGTLTGSNPYTIAGIPSGATITITDSLSAVCKFDTLLTGPNCNCNPSLPILLASSLTACIGDTFPTLKATVIGLATVEWFTQASGGSAVFTGLNFKPTGNVATNTVFYAQARSTDPTCPTAISTGRVTATVNAQDCNKEIDLALSKSIDKKIVQIGDLLTYTIKVWNKSANAATGVEVSDKIATTVQFQAGTLVASRGTASISGNVITWNISNIAAAGDTVTLTYKVKATQEGVHFNTAQICKANEKDADSTPCNDDDDEDDTDTECFTVPFKLCPGEALEASVPVKYTNVVWFKTGSTTPVAQGNKVLFSETGSYTFTTTSGICPATGCCPIIIEPGDNCCPVDLCIPFTIKKTKKRGKSL